MDGRSRLLVSPYALAGVEKCDDETETLEMFTHNEAARHEVAHIHKVAALTHGAPTAA